MMKVKYVGPSDVSLTNGKIYEVASVENGFYKITDNTNEEYFYSPDEFEVIDPQK